MVFARLNRSYQAQFWPGGSNPAVQPPIFTFDAVAPGTVWTGTVSVTTSTVLTAGTNSPNPDGSGSHNDMLVNMIWTLYRNGSPELTWIGLSQAVNVQLFSNDKVVVIGTLPASGTVVNLTTSNPITLVCNYIGYSGSEWDVQPLVPYVSGSTESSPYQPVSLPTELTTATVFNKNGTGSVNFTLNSPGSANFLRVWSLWLSLSVNNAATNVTTAYILSNAGGVLFDLSVMGSGNQALSLTCGPLLVPVSALPMLVLVQDIVGVSTAANTDAGFTYTFDTLV